LRSAFPENNQKIAIILIILVALVLRLIAISARPLWYDEAFSVLFASQGPAAMVQGTIGGANDQAAEEHPLFYYTVLWGWMSVFGDSPLAVRSLSVVSGLGCLALVYLLGKDIFDQRFGLIVATVVALAPFQIHYAQEVRMYALMTFLLMGATYALWKGMQDRRWGWWLLFMVCSALAQYSHNLAVFYLIPLALTPLLFKDWRSLLAAFLSGLGALLLYIPWLMRLPAQFAKVQGNFWIQRPSPTRLISTLLSFVTNLPIPDNLLPVALFVTFFVVALGFWQTFRTLRARRQAEDGVLVGLWFFYLAFTPPLLLFLLSQWQPVYIERALLPSGVIFLAWLGWAFSRTGVPRPIQIFAYFLLIGGMGLGAINHITYTGFPYAPYAELDEYLVENSSDGDLILHSNKLTMLPMVYYDKDLPQSYLADTPGSGSDTLAPATQEVLDLIAEPDVETAVGDAQRVWLVIFEKAIVEYQNLGYSTHPQLQQLNSRFKLGNISNWGDLRLYEFVKE